MGLMRWNTSRCTRELCSSQGNHVLCSPELMSENWAGRSYAVPARSAVRGACCPNWARQKGVIAPASCSGLVRCVPYQVSRGITESRIPKSVYCNSFLFACIQS